MNHLHLHTSPDPALLARLLVGETVVAGDPFARPLLLVPGAGWQRWLSQQAARHSDVGGEGIWAGVEVHPLAALERVLSGDAGDDPWSPGRLVWAVLDAAASDTRLGLLADHLDAGDQRYANALRVARLLRRYADVRPALLEGWTTDPDAAAAALGVDAWQVWLWQALRARVPGTDPLERRRRLISGLRDGEGSLPWPSVHVVAPRTTTPVQRSLLSALAGRTPVHVWLPDAGPQESSNRVGTALGRPGRTWARQWHAVADAVTVDPGADQPGTALGRLQRAILAGTPTPPLPRDSSVEVHASHGLGRQVDVLREALVAAFEDDPSLEPRDVVVLTPEPATLAPHLAAAFGTLDHAHPLRAPHPATRLRVQVVDPGVAANQVHTLLRELLQLGATRATASQLLALAAHPFVARRFGLHADDLDRLEELVDAAAIRWGIGPEHRATFGLATVPQNTWQLGVRRLVLGEAFSADRLTSVDVVATVDDVTSTDTVLIGALAELVSRTGRLVRLLGSVATMGEWADRLRQAIDLMVEVDFADAWQLSQVWAALESIEGDAAGVSVRLGAADVLAVLDDALAGRGARPAFGNGSLVVARLDALARVPHRLVCVVGLDERTFPRRGLGDGDDLVRRLPDPDDSDPGSEDRQAFLDAVLAATERLVVVFQGQSTLTPEPHHPPAAVQELLEAIHPQAVVTDPLQPFDPALFGGGSADPVSFDTDALAAARASVRPRRPAPDRYEVGVLPRTSPLTAIGVDRLASMLRHPGSFLLRERADLSLGSGDPLAESIPVEVDHRTRWRLGKAMLEQLSAGHPADSVVTAAWLSGELPPRFLGSSAVEALAEQATAVHARLLREADAAPETLAVELDVDGVRVTGRVVTRAGRLAEAHFGTVHARHLAEAWVRVLAATVALDRRTDAVLVGGRGTERLVAPPVDLARTFLSDLVALAGEATERVLPLPPRVAEFWARERARGRDPLARADELERRWRWDRDETWRLWWDDDRVPWRQRRRTDDPWGGDESTTLGALAVRFYSPIVKAQS